MGNLRKLPFGANYLNWSEMTELREAIDQKILFRYQTIGESVATRFEAAVCNKFAVHYALGVHNCTEALRLALMATQPKVGDIVYIPAVTFVAVAGAVLSCGMIPVLVDVRDDFSLDPEKLPDDAERVIIAHMEGNVGPVPEGVAFVIEDTAQAMGGRHPDGRYAGTVGYAGTFSFHHNKVLTSGEGGLLITNDLDRAQLMRGYHDHGSIRVQGEYPRWDEDCFFGENFVTSEGIAAIQLQQFRHLGRILAGLERGYQILRETLAGLSMCRFIDRKGGDVKISLRMEFDGYEQRQLVEKTLQQRHLPYWTLERYFLPAHPVLVHRRSLYADGFPWNLATQPAQTAEAFAGTRQRLLRSLCLPISPELSERDQYAEAKAFRTALAEVSV